MNLWLFLGIVFFSSLGVCLACFRRSKLGFATVVAIATSVFVRTIPVRGPTISWWHDPHRYFIGTKAILDSGRLSPPVEYLTWFPGVERFLSWPILHVLSVQIIEIGGIEPYVGLRYIPALLSIATLLAFWLLFRELLPTPKALLAAYLTTLLDAMVYFQTEYHQQGVGILAFALFFYAYFRLTPQPRRSMRGLYCLIVAFAVLSHHFTAVAIVATLIAHQVLTHLYNDLPISRVSVPSVKPTTVLIPVLMAVAIHLFVFRGVIRGAMLSFLALFTDIPLWGGFDPYIADGGGTIVDSFTLIVKIILIGLALPAIYTILRSRDHPRRLSFVIFFGAIGAMTAVIVPIRFEAISRFVVIGMIPIVGFAVISIWKLANPRSLRWSFSIPRRMLFSIGLSILICMSVLGAYPPSLIDHNADISADGYHEIEPLDDQASTSGGWIADYVDSETTLWVQYRTRTIAVFFGEMPTKNVRYMDPTPPDQFGVYHINRQPQPSETADQLYTNGKVVFAGNASTLQERNNGTP